MSSDLRAFRFLSTTDQDINAATAKQVDLITTPATTIIAQPEDLLIDDQDIPPVENPSREDSTEATVRHNTASSHTIIQDIDIPEGYSVDTTNWTATADSTFLLAVEGGYLESDGRSLQYMYFDTPAIESHATVVTHSIVLKDPDGNTENHTLAVTIDTEEHGKPAETEAVPAADYAEVLLAGTQAEVPEGVYYTTSDDTPSTPFDNVINLKELRFKEYLPEQNAMGTRINIKPYTVDMTDWEKVTSDELTAYSIQYFKNVAHGVLYLTKNGGLFYKLTDRVDHTTSASDDCYYKDINIPLLDSNKSPIVGNLTLAILDSEPVIKLNSPGTVKSGATVRGTWDVNYGVDGKSLTDDLQVSFDKGHTFHKITLDKAMDVTPYGSSSFGTITFYSNGTFSFKAGLYNAALSFTMRAVDSESDVTTLTTGINVTSGIDYVAESVLSLGSVSIDEKFLDSGTNPQPYNTTRIIPLAKGLKVDTEGWTQNGTAFTLIVEHGILKYNAQTNRLSFQLTKSLDHDSENIAIETIPLSILQGDKTIRYDLTVKVTDDKPSITMAAQSTQGEPGSTFSGSWNVNYGADGQNDSKALLISFDRGQSYQEIKVGIATDVTINDVNYGSFILNNDSTYSFISNQNAPTGTFEVRLHAKDSDGDGAYQSINLTLKEPVEPVRGLGTIAIDEQYLPTGTAPDDKKLVSTIKTPDGYTPDTTGWEESGSSFTKATASGVLTYDTITKVLTFTHTTAIKHSTGTLDDLLISKINIPFKNADGKVVDYALTVRVTDDEPAITITPQSSTTINPGGVTQGTWSIHNGADTPPANMWRISFDGKKFQDIQLDREVPVIIDYVQYGVLTLKKNGEYNFVASEKAPLGQFSIRLTATDADGDTTYASLPIKITSAKAPISISVDESNLDAGTTVHPYSTLQQIELPAEHTVDTTGWAYSGGDLYYTHTENGGVLRYYAESNTLKYHQVNALDHSKAGEDGIIKHTVEVSLKDKSGTVSTSQIEVSISDDAPTASLAVHDYIITESTQSLNGNWYINYGADGKHEQQAMAIQFDNQTEQAVVIGKSIDVIINDITYGTIIFNKADSPYSSDMFTFTPSRAIPNEGITIKITAVDGDGDKATGQLTLYNDYYLPFEREWPLTVSEKQLAHGTEPAHKLCYSSFELPDGYFIDITRKYDSENIYPEWQQAAPNVHIYESEYISERVSGKLFYNTKTNTITFELVSAATHDIDSDELTSNVYLEVTNSKNEILRPIIVIKIVDDKPILDFKLADPDQGTIDNPVSALAGKDILGTWAVQHGADGAHEKALQVSFDDGKSYQQLTPEAGTSIIVNGTYYGILTLHSNGTYSINVDGQAPQNTFSVKIKATDADNDEAVSPTIHYSVSGGKVLSDEANAYTLTMTEGNVTPSTIPLGNYYVDVSGWSHTKEIGYHKTTDCGLLVYDSEKNHLTLQPSGSFVHGTPGSTNDSVVSKYLPVTLTDIAPPQPTSGNSYQNIIKVAITDAEPTLNFNEKDITRVGGEDYIGSWAVDYGADGAHETRQLEFSVDGGKTFHPIVYGQNYNIDGSTLTPKSVTISFNKDNTFIIKGLDDLTRDRVVTLRATDKDGDIATSTLNIADVALISKYNTVYEGALPSGNGLYGKTYTNITIPKGFSVDTEGWEQIGSKYVKAVPYGRLEYNDMILTYFLEKTVQHPLANSIYEEHYENLDLKIINTSTKIAYDYKVNIGIRDDTPELTYPLDNTVITSGETVKGTWSAKYGADGAAAADSLMITFDGSNYQSIKFGEKISVTVPGNPQPVGTIEFHENSTYTLITNNNAPNSRIEFIVKAIDGDGDSSITHKDHGVVYISHDGTPLLEGVQVNEHYLTRDTWSYKYATQPVKIPNGVTVNTEGWDKQGTDFIKHTDFGLLRYSNGELTYQLLESVTHSRTTNSDPYEYHTQDLATYFVPLSLTDDKGASKEYLLPISILDDEPFCEFSGEVLDHLLRGSTSTVHWKQSPGMDNEEGKTSMQVSFDGGKTYTEITLNKAIPITVGSVTYGKCTFLPNNSARFDIFEDVSCDILQITFKTIDSEGDMRISGDFQLPIVSYVVSDAIDMNEAHLGHDSDEQSDKLTHTFTLPAGTRIPTELYSDWQTLDNITFSKKLPYGVLTYTGNTVTFALTEAVTHGVSETDNIATQVITLPLVSIAANLEDAYTNTFNANLLINIQDDVPTLTLQPEDVFLEPGKVLTGIWGLDVGADGLHEINGFAYKIDTQAFQAIELGSKQEVIVGGNVIGEIEFNADHTYKLYIHDAVDVSRFTLTVVATDKDSDTSTQDINYETPSTRLATTTDAVSETAEALVSAAAATDATAQTTPEQAPLIEQKDAVPTLTLSSLLHEEGNLDTLLGENSEKMQPVHKTDNALLNTMNTSVPASEHNFLNGATAQDIQTEATADHDLLRVLTAF